MDYVVRNAAELREYLNAEAKRIVAELPEDLTHDDTDTLLQHLQGAGFESA